MLQQNKNFINKRKKKGAKNNLTDFQNFCQLSFCTIFYLYTIIYYKKIDFF